jgi:hypothetical protein
MSSRITIRPTTYRGESMFSVTAARDGGWPMQVVVPTRWQADAIKRTIQTGGSQDAISANPVPRPAIRFVAPVETASSRDVVPRAVAPKPRRFAAIEWLWRDYPSLRHGRAAS